MYYGCADPCNFPKCGKFSYVICGNGALHSCSLPCFKKKNKYSILKAPRPLLSTTVPFLFLTENQVNMYYFSLVEYVYSLLKVSEEKIQDRATALDCSNPKKKKCRRRMSYFPPLPPGLTNPQNNSLFLICMCFDFSFLASR